MRETLSQLRTWGLPLGVCTNKQQDDAQNIVRFLFEDQTFRAVVGDHAGSRRKPDPTNVLAMAASFGVQPAEVAYLGDTSVDMKTAVNAGFLPVGVLWGFRGREELIENGAKVLLEEPADLLKKVEFKH
jgi:phosphoglycolate phosphatase